MPGEIDALKKVGVIASALAKRQLIDKLLQIDQYIDAKTIGFTINGNLQILNFVYTKYVPGVTPMETDRWHLSVGMAQHDNGDQYLRKPHFTYIMAV